MKKFLFVVGLLVVGGLFWPRAAAAANNGELVQAPGDSRVYYIEGPLKRHIADFDTFTHWNFSVALIRRISAVELNSHPTGPPLTRVIHYGGHVYLVENGQKRYVPTAQSLNMYGFSFARLVDLNTDTFDRFSEGPALTTPRAVRVPGDSRVFYLDGGTRRPFVSDEVMVNDYGISRDSAPVSAAAASIPVGDVLTNIILYNGNVYVVAGYGKKFYVPSEPALLYNNLRWESMRSVTSDVAEMLPDSGELRPPAVIRTPGHHQIWLTDDNGERRWVPSIEILEHWGLSISDVREVPNEIAFRWPEVSSLTRYVRHGSDHYFILNGRRLMLRDTSAEGMLGVANQRLDVGATALAHISSGDDIIGGGVESLNGYDIPATSGRTAWEQHLYLSTAEANLGRTDASANLHYSVSGTPAAARNGMAGGYGAFGSGASPASTAQERYYIAMRWNYCTWFEDGGGVTQCSNLNTTAKNWHRHKKVIVTNPANGRQAVLSVEESGPAFWTGRVSGLSPEAMVELDAATNTVLTYYWAANQDISLGRIR